MEGMAHWLPIWAQKAGDGAPAASGRSTYRPMQVWSLIQDAANGLELRRDDTLLDVGCARGLMGEQLRRLVGKYVGVDAVPEMVKAFSRRCRSAEVHVACATRLPFRRGEFSKTLLSGVLLVLTRAEGIQAIRELRRVTADGGRGFISGNVYERSQPGPACAPGCQCYAHICAWPVGDLLAVARDAGWRNPSVRRIHPSLPQTAYQWDLVVEA